MLGASSFLVMCAENSRVSSTTSEACTAHSIASASPEMPLTSKIRSPACTRAS